MGNTNNKKSPVIGMCTSPMYAIKRIGNRHLLWGGGGGEANTGVKNNIEAHLLTFDKNNLLSPLKALPASKIETGKFATMNMDVVCVTSPDCGKYLIAAGHGQYCDLYETMGYGTNEDGNLAFNFRSVSRLIASDSDDGFQKSVRFDRSSRGQRLITGSSDGHVRIWNVQEIVTNRNPENVKKPMLEIRAHDCEVQDIDISPDGRHFFSIGTDGKAVLWDMATGKRVLDLPLPVELGDPKQKLYRVRSIKFTNLGGSNVIFVVAYNSIQRSSKAKSFLALWAYNRERQSATPIIVRETFQGEGGVSNLCVSSCGRFTGIGSMGGSVAIYDTDEMKPLKIFKETHGIFVTGIEFLDHVASDLQLPPVGDKAPLIPATAAGTRASLVSLSADQTVQLHVLPFEPSPSTTEFLVKLAIFSLLVYYTVWFFASL